jgi:Transmembrane domain of unknown function (DUF3566)
VSKERGLRTKVLLEWYKMRRWLRNHASDEAGGWGEPMRAVVRTDDFTARETEQPAFPRQTTVVVRRVQAWSVLKFSLLFYFCLMLIFLFALLILYWVLGVMGVIDSFSHFLTSLGFGGPKIGFKLNGYWIFSRLFLLGVVGVVLWSLVNMCVAMLYNLVSDVVGGIQVTLFEKP